MLEERDGKKTKVPYTIRGKRAASTDARDWSTYAECKKALDNFGTGIGIVFTSDQTLLGIDIDHVLENKKLVGEHRVAIEKLVTDADTYTEISPSGTGLHLYLALTEPLALLANRHSPFEAYTSGRFFTFSENAYGKSKREVRFVSNEEASKLLGIIGYPWHVSEHVFDQPVELIGDTLFSDFSDEELLERMFSAKNGETIRELYEGNLTAYKDDASRADSALLSHLAFWSQRHSFQMERVWLASPLGKREKTQNRDDYRKRSIANAIKKCKETYKVAIENTIDFLYTVSVKGEKSYSKNTENVCRALRHHADFAGKYRFDEFKNRMEVFEHEQWRQLSDTDSIDVQTRLSIIFPFLRTVSKDMVFDAIIKVSKENAFDSAKQFVKSIVWDGEKRLDSWLHHAYGVPIDDYHTAVGSNWLKGLIKRIMVPGCKFDYVLVLEGPQGAKKSTSLSVIGEISHRENWHVETTMSTDSKDFFMQFEGKVIIEFSEGETLTRTEVKKMKAIITTAVDRYRASYGRTAEDFPRRCIFAMTTNQEEYLKDETGNRRWLPVKLELAQANIEWLKEHRDQLFAEAYQRVMVDHETTYEFPEDATRAMQDARRITSPNAEKIIEWYYNSFDDPISRENGVTATMAFIGALSGFGAMKKFEEMEITEVFSNVLKLKKRRKMVNGTQNMRWFADAVVSPIQQDEMSETMIVDGEEFDNPWK